MRAKKLAELRALEAERFVSQLENRLRVAEQRIVQAERQLQVQEVLTEQKDREKNDAVRWAQELEHESQKIKQLWSWKLTRPFRYVYRNYIANLFPSSRRDWLAEAQQIAPDFDEASYATLNPDVLSAGMKPAQHYVQYGQFQSRKWNLHEALPPISAIVPLQSAKSTVLVVCASSDLAESEVFVDVLADWVTQHNVVFLAFDELPELPAAISSSLTAYSYHKVAKRSYNDAKLLLNQVLQQYPIDAALVYGMDAKTCLATLRTYGVPTVSFMDKRSASASSIFALQEVFFGSTYTVLEDASVTALCELVFPQLNQRYVLTRPEGTVSAQWWWDKLCLAQQQQQQDQLDSEYLLASPDFDAAFLEPEIEKQADKLELVTLYLRRWKAQISMRKPMVGFHPGIYAQSMSPDDPTDPFAHYLRAGKPQGAWTYPVIRDQGTERLLPDAVALHIHAYYPDMLADILERLAANTVRPDLFISVKNSEDAEQVRVILAQYAFTLVDLQVVPNVGRDIGPFLTAFGRALVSNYRIIGHLHTKKSWHVAERNVVEAWQHFLLSCLVGIPDQVFMADSILAAMQRDPSLGIVFPEDPMVLAWDRNYAFAKELAPELGIADLPQQFNFPAGDMFWIRSEVLQRFVDLGFQWEHYPLEPLGSDGTMLHTIERFFGVVPQSMGLQCAVSAVPGVTR